MGRSKWSRLGLVASVWMVSSCTPDSTDGSMVDDPFPRDVATATDSATADAGAPQDLGATQRDTGSPPLDTGSAPLDTGSGSLDAGAPTDVPTLVDVPAAIDLPAPVDRPAVDAGPPDTGCNLPPPAARPPAAGPDGSSVVRALAAEHPDWLRDSCLSMGGHSRFLFEALRRGRMADPRWGLDRRTGTLSGDIVTYFYGDGCPEGRREVYMFDIIVRHCGRPGVDAPPEPGWIDRSSEGGVWTLMGYDPSAPADAGTVPVDVPTMTTRAPLPDARPTLEAVAREHGDWLQGSCVAMGGNNNFLFEVVRRLRRSDTRWGLNWKRGVIGDMSQDVINYYWGAAGAPMEGSRETYVVDVIVGHCGDRPTTGWNDVTGVGGADARWTLAGRTDL